MVTDYPFVFLKKFFYALLEDLVDNRLHPLSNQLPTRIFNCSFLIKVGNKPGRPTSAYKLTCLGLAYLLKRLGQGFLKKAYLIK